MNKNLNGHSSVVVSRAKNAASAYVADVIEDVLSGKDVWFKHIWSVLASTTVDSLKAYQQYERDQAIVSWLEFWNCPDKEESDNGLLEQLFLYES